MRISEVLTESRRNKVILIDFQPEYMNYGGNTYTRALSNACKYINQKNPDVLVFFNGMDVGSYDDEDTVAEHYADHGLENFSGIQFREKGYGFLRGWMDQGIDPRAIIKVIRAMVLSKVNDSRMLVGGDDSLEYKEKMAQLVGDDYNDIMIKEPLYIPEIAIGELKTFSGCLIGGGGKDECLREIEILMSAFNIRYNRVKEWMY